MTQHSSEDFGMNAEDKDLLQLFNKSMLRNGTKRIYSRAKFFIYSQI